MIPKKIHYCWFGDKPLPKEAQKCIESWKKYCPDYEIIEWNESNYDLNKNEYVKKAYENKKYAFLTDYARLDIIYNYGGIYLDTDVELLKPLDNLLNCKGFMAMEQVGTVATGLGFGAIQNHPFIKENKEYYEKNDFLNKQGEFKPKVCVSITTDLLIKHGFISEEKKQIIADMDIYPTEYFCPMTLGTRKIKITKNTYSIHHYEASWKSKSKIIRRISYRLIPLKQKIKKVLKIK